MGCNCGKGRASVTKVDGGSGARRTTVYQVMSNKDGSVLEEHSTLSEARTAASAVGGRVKVTSKIQ